jgi:hypothetical protein
MTKLYNFAVIKAWHGPCLERLHGGRIEFKDGFHEKLRRDLHQGLSWEEADFRCLHLCFLPRSSQDSNTLAPRQNIMDVYNISIRKTLGLIWDRLRGKPPIDWKEQRYGRGPLVAKSITPFFSASDVLP